MELLRADKLQSFKSCNENSIINLIDLFTVLASMAEGSAIGAKEKYLNLTTYHM